MRLCRRRDSVTIDVMKKPFSRGVVSILAASVAVAGAVGAVGAGDPARGKVTGGAIGVYLPEQAPGRHTAVLRVKKLSAGTSFYAGQVLVIGAVPP